MNIDGEIAHYMLHFLTWISFLNEFKAKSKSTSDIDLIFDYDFLKKTVWEKQIISASCALFTLMILKSSIWKNFTCAMFLSFRFFSCRDFLLNYSQRNIPENSKIEDVTLISSRVGDVISNVWLSLIDQSGDRFESWSRRSFSIIFLAIVFFSKKTLQSLLFMGNLGNQKRKKNNMHT